MKVDYIIVGLGLAGLAFAEELINANKTFLVFEDNSQTSSLVAAGVYNPVVLRKFTAVWKATEQLNLALLIYEKLEKKLNQKFDKKFVIKRAFKSVDGSVLRNYAHLIFIKKVKNSNRHSNCFNTGYNCL